MANTILLKRKTTAGAPSLASLSVGEVCLVIPDSALYWKKDAATLVGPYLATASATWGSITGTLSSQTDLNNALGLKAPLASPALTGTPTAPTASGGTNTTQLATTAFVQSAITSLINGAPGVLDTLQELAAALGDDPNFAATITSQLATKISFSDTIDGGTIS